MKKLFLLMIIAVLFISCNTNGEHTTKYSNGNIDHYTYKNDKLTITMENGDGSDGTLSFHLTEQEIQKIYDYQYFKNWSSYDMNKRKSKLDGIVRYIKSYSIEPKYCAKYPMSVRYNDLGTIGISDGHLSVFYDMICKNGFGVEGKLKVVIQLSPTDKEPYRIDVY